MSARKSNKALRRERILDAARKILSEDGYDSLTTRGLAEAAGVTVPTIYNLLGGKDNILAALIEDGTAQVWEQWTLPANQASLQTVERWIDACHAVIGGDQAAMKAAVVASSHQPGLFAVWEGDANAAPGPAWYAVDMATQLCRALQDSGVLRGVIAAEALGEQCFVCFRDSILDWGQGLISLAEFRRRFARGVFMLLCSDATETARQQLIENINSLHVADETSAVSAAGGA